MKSNQVGSDAYAALMLASQAGYPLPEDAQIVGLGATPRNFLLRVPFFAQTGMSSQCGTFAWTRSRKEKHHVVLFLAAKLDIAPVPAGPDPTPALGGTFSASARSARRPLAPQHVNGHDCNRLGARFA